MPIRLTRTASLAGVIGLLSSCGMVLNSLPIGVCSPDQVDTTQSQLSLDLSDTPTAGKPISGTLHLSNGLGRACRLADPESQLAISDASPSIGTASLRLKSASASTETLSSFVWNEDLQVYTFELVPKRSGTRTWQPSLDGRAVPLSPETKEAVSSVVVLPGPPATVEFFAEDAPIEDTLRVTDNEALRLTAHEFDEFGNEAGQVALGVKNSGEWSTNLEADDSESKALRLRPRGVSGSFDVQLEATSSQGLVTARTVRVESQPYLPTLADLRVWFRADALSLTDGAPVVSWPDSSSVTNEALAAAVPAERPLYRATGLGGRPAVQYTGTQLLARSPLNFGASSLTVVAVYSASGRAGSGGGARIVNNGHSGWNKGYFVGADATTVQGGIGGTNQATSTLVLSTSASVTNAYDGVRRIVIYHYDRNQQLMSMYINGVRVRLAKNTGTIGTLSSDQLTLDTSAATQLNTDNHFPSRGFRI